MKRAISDALGWTGLLLVLALIALMPFTHMLSWVLYAVLVPIGWLSGAPAVPPEFG